MWPSDCWVTAYVALEQKSLETPELDEQECTQKVMILPGPTKKWQIERIKRWRIRQILLYILRVYVKVILSIRILEILFRLLGCIRFPMILKISLYSLGYTLRVFYLEKK